MRIVALARGGRRHRALEAYEELTRRFSDELGIAPGKDMRRLADAVRADDVEGLVAWIGAAEEADAPAADRTPLVGRGREMAVAEEVVASARSGGLALLVVRGEAGIGKSALLDSLLGADDHAGPRFVAGRCDRHGVVPLQPALQALRHLVGPAGGPAGIELARLVGVDASDALPRVDDAAVTRHQLLDLIGQVVDDASRRGATVLVFDDMQWADPLTLALLEHLVQARRSTPVVLALGVRSEAGGLTDLDRWLADVGTEVPVTEVDLAPMGPADTAALLGPDVDADQVHAASGGNPLYALQLGRFLEARPDGDASLPEGLRRVCRARIDQLDAGVLQVLEALSVLGPSAWLGDVARVLGTTRDLAASAVAGGRRAGVVTWSDGIEEVRFVHGVIRTETYEGLDPGRRATLHRAAAGIPGSPRVAVALHMATAWPLAATDDELAVAVVRAGFAAMSVGATDTAIHFFELLLHMGTTTAGSRVAALLGLGAQLAEAGDATRARTMLAEGRAEAKAAGRWDLVADSLESSDVSLVTVSAPEVEVVIAEIDEVLTHIEPADHTRRARLLCWRADTQINKDPARSLGDLDQARLHAARVADDGVDALVAYVDLRHASARSEPAADLLRRIDVVLEARRHDPGHVGRVGFVRSCTLIRLGRLEDARKAIDATIEACGADPALAMVLAIQSLGLMAAGHPVPEMEVANDAVVAPHEGLAGLAMIGRMIHLSVVRREQLRLREVEPLVALADRVGSQHYMRVVLAAARVEDDDHVVARRVLASLADVVPGPAVDWCADVTAAVGAEVSSDLGDAIVVGPLRERLGRIQGEVVVGYGGVVCLGRADRYLGRLSMVEGDLDRAIAHFASARVVDATDGLDLWSGWAAADEAAARQARGAPGDAALARTLVVTASDVAEAYGSPRLARSVARLEAP